MKMIHICPVCKGNRNKVVNLPYKTFRHLDFAEFRLKNGNNICECFECGAVFRSFALSEEGKSIDLLEVENIYKSENYSHYQEEHMVHEIDSDTMLPLSEVQANLIIRSLPNRSVIRGILDIGCLDGKLLVSLQKRLQADRLIGFDVDQRDGFPVGSGIEFTQNPIDELTGKFDLIVLSQSIMYIPDLQNLFENISRLLTPHGIVFIHAPNLSLKPCAAMLGDQIHYFSKESINSMLSHFNFECNFFSDTPFPKDILLFAKKQGSNSENRDNNLSHEPKLLNEISSYLNLMANNIQRISDDTTNLTILGTTIDASFVYHLIPDRVSCFVDENSKKVGTTFLGKAVRHPRSIAENDVVIIPMGKTGEYIRKRFSEKYLGTYVCA